MPVSIGTLYQVIVAPPNQPAGEILTSVTITGMGNIGSYPNTSPIAAPNENYTSIPAPNGNPAIVENSAQTTFVVAPQSTYTIIVSATYQNGDSGETTVEFDPQKPTGTLQKIGQGQTQITAGQTGLTYRNPGDPNNPDGITIQATTTPIPYQANGQTVYVSGNFMFIQTVSASNSYVAGGNTYVINSSSATTPSIDNGVPGGTTQIGHSAYPTGGATDPQFIVAPPYNGGNGVGWTLPTTQGNPPQPVTTASYIFTDTTAISPPAGTNNLTSLTVGSTGGNPPVPGGSPEMFTMYLMYQPFVAGSSGVWVGLSSVTWGWGGNATSSNGTTLDAASLTTSQSAASFTQPLSGNAAFPTWTGSTQSMFSNGWKKQ